MLYNTLSHNEEQQPTYTFFTFNPALMYLTPAMMTPLANGKIPP
jgi:hypothetical protein